MAGPIALASPMSATTPGALLMDKKADGGGGRGNKKRGSISANGSGSNLASPAIRPKISPSIKPLLPEGSKSLLPASAARSSLLNGLTAALHSPTHALLLASKSSYQNLLEGNHQPGVSYPDSLSTGLTSKRTSHKVAEQGRRNRINEALKEMQALVPKEYLFGKNKNSSIDDDSPEGGGGVELLDDKDGKEDSAKSHSSKAATVESANVYIRKMQQKEAERDEEYERMRRRLEQAEKILAGSGKACDAEVAASSEKAGSSEAKDSASPASVDVQ